MAHRSKTLILVAAFASFGAASFDCEAKNRIGTSGAAPPESLSSTALAAAAADSRPGEPTAEELARKRQEELARVRKRLEDDAKLRKADEERKAMEAAEAAAEARKKREAQEAQKRDALDRAREQKRQDQERQAQCVIKPVMSDADIEKCREVRR